MDVSPSTTEVELHLFAQQQVGRVNQVRIPKDEHSQSHGFAIITFRQHEDAAVAMKEFQGCKLDGLILQPRWATPQRKKVEEQKQKPKRNGSRRKRPEKAVMESVKAVKATG